MSSEGAPAEHSEKLLGTRRCQEVQHPILSRKEATAQGAVIVALGKLMASLSYFLCFLIFQMVTTVLTSQEGGEVVFSILWVGSYEVLGSDFLRVFMFKIFSI